MGCTVVTMENKNISHRGNRSSYKRQLSLSDVERFLRTTIESGMSGKNSEKDLETRKQLENVGKRQQVYGRLCTTKDADTAPVNLSDTPGRKTAFIFGPETVYGALIENLHDPYTMLLKLGFLPEYIHLKACKQKACYWLILLSPKQNSVQSTAEPGTPSASNAVPVPATWDGLMSFIRICYPEALPAVQAHWDLIKSKPVEFFERRSDVRFIDALSNPHGPDFMNYEKFKSLPKPQTDWETRLFLYCEVRILELFAGDGHTWSDAGVKGEKEYLCSNYFFEKDLSKEDCITIPLTVNVPQEVRDKYDDR